MKKINIRPDTGIYATYRNISYTHWVALAEFIDNSVQSFFDYEKELKNEKYYDKCDIDIIYDYENDVLTIEDKAFGMDEYNFERALILNRPPKSSSLNEFGMGLKVAACWFSNLWYVESTQLGNRYKYKAEIDVNALVKYKIEEIDPEEDIVSKKDHYTRITLKNLNQKIKKGKQESAIKEHLTIYYGAILKRGDVRISYNGVYLSPPPEVVPYWDEFGDGKTWKEDVSFTIPYKNQNLKVYGFVGLRAKGSQRDAGLMLLRYKRTIIGGPKKNYRPEDIFGAKNLYPSQRVYGELNLDGWPVTQAKNDFDWYNENLEEKFKEKLKEILAPYIEKASKIRLREDEKKRQEQREAEEANQEKQQSNQDYLISTNEQVKNENNLNYFENEEFFKEKIFNFSYENIDYKFKVKNERNSSEALWMGIKCESESREDENCYNLTFNINHPFFKNSIKNNIIKEWEIMFCIALAVAEIHGARTNNASQDTRILMDNILKKIGNFEFESQRQI